MGIQQQPPKKGDPLGPTRSPGPDGGIWHRGESVCRSLLYMAVGQNPGTPVVHIKIAGIYGCE